MKRDWIKLLTDAGKFCIIFMFLFIVWSILWDIHVLLEGYGKVISAATRGFR